MYLHRCLKNNTSDNTMITIKVYLQQQHKIVKHLIYKIQTSNGSTLDNKIQQKTTHGNVKEMHTYVTKLKKIFKRLVFKVPGIFFPQVTWKDEREFSVILTFRSAFFKMRVIIQNATAKLKQKQNAFVSKYYREQK